MQPRTTTISVTVSSDRSMVIVRNGVVHLHGIATSDHAREATIVAAENTAGVKKVYDHPCFVDTYTGLYVESPRDVKAAS
ncbi:BON domain-containing protein [Bradyrhizobium elkanii]|uniref:BON domain-containing protein n=2 Tax=Bradyrhizobium TaxID=374 RepID=UPI0035DC4B4D